MSTPLNLAGADLTGFDPIEPGDYDAHVHKIELVAIESDEGKMPQGTPGYYVTFAIDGGKENGKFVWNRFWMPQPGTEYYENNQDKVAKINGMLARFIIALGYPEKDVVSGKFKFDPEDAVGKECHILVGKTKDGQYNTLRSVKPRGANLAASGVL